MDHLTLRGITSSIGSRKSREHLCDLAFIDSLTGVYNRNMLEEMRTYFNKIPLFVTIVDINNLKPINDNLGHHVGDKIIKETAKQLKEVFELVFRLGGDEFLAITSKYVGFDIENVSYGTVKKQSNTMISDAMKEADSKMYQHKKMLKEKQTLEGEIK